MKKNISILIVTILLLSLLPVGSVSASGSTSLSADEKPLLIYIHKDFESQAEDEQPYGFLLTHKSGEEVTPEMISVKKIEKNGNPDNKAMHVAGVTVTNTNPQARARYGLQWAPLQKDFVISFNFLAENFESAKDITMYYNVTRSRSAKYWDDSANYGISNFKLLEITTAGNITFNKNTTIATEIKAGVWHRLDMVIHMDSHKAEISFNGGEAVSASIPSAIENIAELRINTPLVDGSGWYFDDFKFYESSTLIDDETVDAEWEKWATHELYPGEKYELGRVFNYDVFVYYTLYNKFLASVGGNKFYKDNRIHHMAAPITEASDGRLIIPVRQFVESLGATVYWNDATKQMTINYGDKNILFTVGDDIYYINGKPAKLYHPVSIVNGASCVQLDVLVHHLGLQYTREGDILCFGDPIDLDRDFGAMEVNATENTYEEEILARIQDFLTFDRPNTNELLSIYQSRYPDNAHPRLITDDFEAIIKGMEKEPELKKAVEALLVSAEDRLSGEPVTYGLSDGVRSTFATKLYNNGRSFGFAYKIAETRYNLATTEEEKAIYKAEMQKYADRAWLDIANMESFPDFNPGHLLCVGNSANGVAFYYDWMYSAWTDEQREVLEGIIYRNVLQLAQKAFSHPIWTTWTYVFTGDSNQTHIINNGVMSCAIALMDKYPELCSEIIEKSLRSVERAYYSFYPDGQWYEGVSYWQYTVDTLPFYTKTLLLAFGDDFGIFDVPGFLDTAYFPLGLRGSKQTFPSGDDTATSPYHSMMMFQAEQTGDIPLAKLRKDSMSTGDLIDVVCWVYDTDESEFDINDMQNDRVFHSLETGTMRTGWSGSDTVVYFHGGAMDAGHGHYDAGSFQFDMLGTRWACEVPKEDYNLTGYGAYNTNDVSTNYPDGYPFTGRHYYRIKGEGHNLVIANYANTANGLTTEYADVNMSANVKITKESFGENGSFMISNMTETNEIYDCAIRGLKLDKVNNEIVIQDDFIAKVPTEFWWFMHTQAEIEIAEDGKSAILTRNGNRLHAQIISDGDYEFIELAAKPLDQQGYNYGVAIPSIQSPNEAGVPSEMNDVTTTYRKLAVKTKTDTDHFVLSVAFNPLYGAATVPDHISEYVPMEKWKFESAKRETINNITVDGVQLAGFNPEIYNYGIEVKTEKVPIPQIAVENNDEGIEAQVVQAVSIPGTANVVLSRAGEKVGVYSIAITPINDTSKFYEENQIPIVSYEVTDEPEAENAAINLFDANLGTKFATDEHGGAVTVDFGEVINELHSMKIACMLGDTRNEKFKIEYSLDGKTWTTVFDGQNSGTTTNFEEFLIGDVPARYARVSFFGNSNSSWVSVSELYFTQKGGA